MRKLLISLVGVVFCVMAFPFPAQSQGIWWVIGSGGQYFQSAPNQPSLIATTGEMMVSARSANYSLTEGFHQVFLRVTPIAEPTDSDWIVNVYPNPTSGFMTIETNRALQCRLFNMQGQAVSSLQHFATTQSWDISFLTSGTYVLQLYETGNHSRKMFKVQVIH